MERQNTPRRRNLLSVAVALAVAGVFALVAAGASCGTGSGEQPAARSGSDSPGLDDRPTPAPGSHNVLLITVDTLRADHLGSYGYMRATSPAIDGLASEGVLFLRAQSPRSLTWPTLSSILTSRYPRTHGVRRNGQKLDPSIPTLPRILQERGYVAAAFAASMKTAPDPGLDYRFAADSKLPWPEQDRQVTTGAIEWIAENGDRRFFAWLHYIGPHDPYAPDPPFDTMFDPEYRGGYDGSQKTIGQITSERIDLAPEDLAHMIALYDGEVAATDEQIGHVLAAIENLGLKQDTLVVFTADHGEELYQRNHYFQHGCSIYDSTLHVPLVMRLPGMLPAGAKVAPTVELIDIVPTVLGVEKIDPGEVSSGLEGIDLLPLILQVSSGAGGGMAPDGGDGSGRGGGAETAPASGAWPTGLFEESGIPLPADRFVDGRRISVAEYRDKILALRTDDWRYIYNPEGFHPRSGPFKFREGDPGYIIGEEELYHTAVDPLEKTNVIAEHPEVAAAFREALIVWASTRPNEMKKRDLDEETLKELRSLGYVR